MAKAKLLIHTAFIAIFGISSLSLQAQVKVKSSNANKKAKQAEHPLRVTNAWGRPTRGEGRMTALYMSIQNTTNRDLTITGVRSKNAGKAELHRSVEVDGMMHMKKQDEIKINARQSLKMQPRSYHIMLMDIPNKLQAGDNVIIRFSVKNENELELSIPIKEDMQP